MDKEKGTFPAYGAVDIHSHVLPGVDDGAASMEEALALLDLDRKEGVSAVFATPHYGEENVGAPDRELMRETFHELLKKTDSRKTDLYSGTEWYCSEDLADRIRGGKAFPMGASDWYMVEFLEWGNQTEPAEVMLRRLKKLKDNGIKTILAHPERYRAIRADRDLAKRICDLGVLLQVNAYDLYLNQEDSIRNLAQWMARERMISFLGSDMHGLPPKRVPRMKEGIRWLIQNVDGEYAKDVIRGNAERLLGVRRLPQEASRR